MGHGEFKGSAQLLGESTTLQLTAEEVQMVLTRGEHSKARKLRSEGYSLREIGRRIGCSHEEVRRIVRIGSTRGMRVDRNGRARAPRVKEWVPGPGRLTLAQREEISLGLERGDTLTSISILLGKSVSTESREVKASGGRDRYRAWKAHERAAGRVRRPKARRLSCPRLAAQVTTWLEEWWSPEEIALRLRTEFPDDPIITCRSPTAQYADRRWPGHAGLVALAPDVPPQGRAPSDRPLHRTTAPPGHRR